MKNKPSLNLLATTMIISTNLHVIHLSTTVNAKRFTLLRPQQDNLRALSGGWAVLVHFIPTWLLFGQGFSVNLPVTETSWLCFWIFLICESVWHEMESRGEELNCRSRWGGNYGVANETDQRENNFSDGCAKTRARSSTCMHATHTNTHIRTGLSVF